MDKGQTFRFSSQELKKINILLPKGYKFITRDELYKRQSQKIVAKKRTPPPSVFAQSITPLPAPAPAPAALPKVKIQKEDDYMPEKKVVIPPPPVQIAIEDQPAGTTQKFLERVKKHPAYEHLYFFKKVNESDPSLRQIEEKVIQLGQRYRITDIQAQIQSFLLLVYKYSVKTSTDYRQAAELENHMINLLKVERLNEAKKTDLRGQGVGQSAPGRKKGPQIKTYQPLSSYKVATSHQKRQLGMMIRKLTSQNLQQVIYIIFESAQVKEYTFDLDNIHIKKFRELEDYVKKCMQRNAEWDPRGLEDEQFSLESQFVIDNDDD